MADRREQLKRTAASVKESVAGTFGEARAAAAEGARQVVGELQPDRGQRDQFEARAERARIQGRQLGVVEARQEAIDEIRDEFKEAQKKQLEAQYKARYQPELAQAELRADRAEARTALIEGRREAIDEVRDERVDTLKARSKQQTMDRLESPEPAERPEPQQSQPAFGGMFGVPNRGPPAREPEQNTDPEPAPAAPMGGPFGQPPAMGPPADEPADGQPPAGGTDLFGGALGEGERRGGDGLFF